MNRKLSFYLVLFLMNFGLAAVTVGMVLILVNRISLSASPNELPFVKKVIVMVLVFAYTVLYAMLIISVGYIDYKFYKLRYEKMKGLLEKK